MAIVEEDIERVKAAVNIADIIGQHTQLKRVGRRMQGQCPFPSHNDKSPSFSVNVETISTMTAWPRPRRAFER